MTLWHPDTCGCQIEISDDQTSSNWGQPIKHAMKCPIHTSLGVDHKNVLAENQRKNLAITDIRQTYPSSGIVGIVWSFDASRVLSLTLASSATISTASKNTLQTLLDSKYGVGKVLVK